MKPKSSELISTHCEVVSAIGFGLVGWLLYLFCQIGPFFTVGQTSVEQRLNPRKGFREGSEQRLANDVDELNLHFGQFILTIPIHHGLVSKGQQIRGIKSIKKGKCIFQFPLLKKKIIKNMVLSTYFKTFSNGIAKTGSKRLIYKGFTKSLCFQNLC